jgi:hypothetical protein
MPPPTIQGYEQATVMSKLRSGYLAVPRAFLSQVLPGLTDTELRVLLVVLVRTVGWVEQGKPRRRAWIARSVFVSETGRSPDAITRATQSLAACGLLRITDEQGARVDARLRRRISRLYFEPALDRLGFSNDYFGASPHQEVDRTTTTPDRVLKDAPNVKRDITTLGAQNTTQPERHERFESTGSVSIEVAQRVAEEKRRIRERFENLNRMR